MDGSHHCVELKNPDLEDFTLYDSIYMKFKNKHNSLMVTVARRVLFPGGEVV